MPLFKKKENPSQQLQDAVSKVKDILTSVTTIFNSQVEELGAVEEYRDRLREEISNLKDEKQQLTNQLHTIKQEAQGIQNETVELYNKKIDDLNEREQNFLNNTEKVKKDLDKREAEVSDVEKQKDLATKAINKYSDASLRLKGREDEITRREKSIESQKDEWVQIKEAKQLLAVDASDVAEREAKVDSRVVELLSEAERLQRIAGMLNVRSNVL